MSNISALPGLPPQMKIALTPGSVLPRRGEISLFTKDDNGLPLFGETAAGCLLF